MGKQPGPSFEELEFIFECFTRGISVREVLYEMEDKEFPRRNPRFILERKRHYDVARKVLDSKSKENKSSTVTKEQKHFLLLAKIASALLINGLETILPSKESSDFYTIGQPEHSDFLEDEDIIDILLKNIDFAILQYGQYDITNCFIPHVEAENREIKSEGFTEYLKTEPLKLIEILKVTSRRQTFKGTCPICEDW